MQGRPVTPESALAAWESLALDPRTCWLDPTGEHERYFRRFVAGRKPSPNFWNDAWLAALATAAGCRLTSFDADFKAYGLADFEQLKS
jgi:predicted nucleic acid-binding protein